MREHLQQRVLVTPPPALHASRAAAPDHTGGPPPAREAGLSRSDGPPAAGSHRLPGLGGADRPGAVAQRRHRRGGPGRLAALSRPSLIGRVAGNLRPPGGRDLWRLRRRVRVGLGGRVGVGLGDDLLHHRVRVLRCERVQVDEVWAFVGMKARKVPRGRYGEFGVGDMWTFTALDPDTKLIVTWLVGRRNTDAARHLLVDVGRRIEGRFQHTTDGASFYRPAAADAFGPTVDYSQLQKLYERPPDAETRYSPPICVGARRAVQVGQPDPDHTSTSHIVRLIEAGEESARDIGARVYGSEAK